MGCPTLLPVRLVHHETSHQKDTFVSTFFRVFLSLKIVTIFCNLVLLNACKYFYSPRYFTACGCLLSSIILDTQPLTLINGNSASGTTWEPPKKYYTRCIFAFREAFPRSPVPQGPSHLLPSRRPAVMPIRPVHEGGFVKTSKGESSASKHREHRAILACSDYFS